MMAFPYRIYFFGCQIRQPASLAGRKIILGHRFLTFELAFAATSCVVPLTP
jgi:hypothetical protein